MGFFPNHRHLFKQHIYKPLDAIQNIPYEALMTAPVFSLLSYTMIPVIYRNIRAQKLRRAHQITAPEGIEFNGHVQLGGIPQGVLIRGNDRKKPILLCLHGGPGLPIMPFHTYNAELEKHFIVVHWDQRGAGKSYNPLIPAESMTLDTIVNDCYELIRWLCQTLGHDQVILAGYSWGSVVGLTLASRYPEVVKHYVGICQIANMAKSEAISYKFIQEQAKLSGNRAAIRAVQAIGEPPYRDHRAMLEQRMWLDRFGGFFHKGMTYLRFYESAFVSPSYTLDELKDLFRGLDFSSRTLWPILYATDLPSVIKQVDVPCLFLAGKFDYVTPSEIFIDYYDHLEAPKGKELVWMEHSAHWPFLEEPLSFQQVLISRFSDENP